MALDLWRDRETRNAPKSLLEEVWGALQDVDRGYGSSLRPQSRMVVPACDIAETDDHFILTFDAPGVKKEDINIEVTGRTLTVSGERKREEQAQKGSSYRLERSFGTFSRSFELPEGTNTEAVEAGYEHGVLKVTVPKAELGKTRKIQIGESGKNQLKSVGAKSEAKAANS